MIGITAGNWVAEDEDIYPKILLSKIGTFPTDYHSCVSREEQHQFQFSVYDLSSDVVETLLNRIESIYDFSTLSISGRKFEGCFFSGKSIMETEPGKWFGFIQYTVHTKKDLSSNNYTNVTSGNDLREAITNRIRNTLLEYLLDNYSVGYQPEGETKLPYLSIGRYAVGDSDYTTQSRQEQSQYSLYIYAYQLDELESIVEQVENLFDYAKFDLNKECMSNEWAGNTIQELEPGIWHAEINYMAMLEKSIA